MKPSKNIYIARYPTGEFFFAAKTRKTAKEIISLHAKPKGGFTIVRVCLYD